MSSGSNARSANRVLKRNVMAGGLGLMGGYLYRKARERKEKKQRLAELKKSLGGRKLVLFAVGKPDSQEKKAAFMHGFSAELGKLAGVPVPQPPKPAKPPKLPTTKVPTPPTVRAVKTPGG